MVDEVISQNGNGEKKDQDGLKELLDSSYPLLQKFRENCPGTFKHSQALSGMVEGISISLGLDITFMKVAAMYHDVGKMLNPKYFTENQLEDEEPHSNLDPFVSYNLITRHISDTSLILLSDENFPRDLIKIATQHHGNNVLRYFCDKSGTDVEDNFRYKGEKPSCVEAAILMICDSIEARSRSEVQSGKSNFNPTEVIEDTLNSLMSDGQLDDVVMRLGDLQTIKDALAKELEGTFQKRVDYNKAKEEGGKKHE
ncbi:MAG: HDIG domain-containing protein [Vallitaleaceae bacterium]|nr:HDIG domain-containing protein [Vallitaleaceae bacterium]